MGANGSPLRQPVFEFDQAKSRANEIQHGIDFRRADEMWDDPYLLRIQARTQGELRFIFIGHLDGAIWAAIATYRNRSIRLISVRRARPEEVALYEVQ